MSEKKITVRIAPDYCKQCGSNLRRTKRMSWGRGYTECQTGSRHNWYGDGETKTIKIRKIME